MNAIKYLFSIAIVLGFLSQASAEINMADRNLTDKNHTTGDGENVAYVKKGDSSKSSDSQCPCNQAGAGITASTQPNAPASGGTGGDAAKGTDGSGL